MAGGTLTLRVVTPERLVIEAEGVGLVVAPGALGEIGILPEHSPLVTTLEPGEFAFERAGKTERLALGGGFLEVAEDVVTVLAEAAEGPDEIDAGEAERALGEAEVTVAGMSLYSAEYPAAERARRHAMARLSVARSRT